MEMSLYLNVTVIGPHVYYMSENVHNLIIFHNNTCQKVLLGHSLVANLTKETAKIISSVFLLLICKFWIFTF